MLKTVTPYLFFKGNCKEAVEFYSEVFEGKVSEMKTYGEVDEKSVDNPDRIIHARLEVDDQVFMCSDVPDEDLNVRDNRNVYLVLEFDSEEAIKDVYEKLKADGDVQMELADMFWGAKYAKLIDKYNIGWDLNYTKPQNK
ncbi:MULTISPECIES: VOC family protein [Staphylococcus]|uniref:VOC family protein n=1 Tax=Staphylococcus hsinchuensis TaxID=3051183 RepID=A0ABZ3EEM1_9STAP|nr:MULTISPECIES: VOC family protein [unclassified Staphylococcus]